jgi:4-carboxymuconolactone decarboxylase
MMQLSLIEESEHPELAMLIKRIRAERGGRFSYPFNLLLHSPAIAEAWLQQITAVRWKISFDGAIRELVIVRIANLCKANFHHKSHGIVYGPKAGLTAAQIDSIGDWKSTDLYTSAQRAALAYTDAMTIDIVVAEDIQTELQRHFNQRQIIELTVLIGTYNMHTRVFQALEIERRSLIHKGEPSSLDKNSYFP